MDRLKVRTRAKAPKTLVVFPKYFPKTTASSRPHMHIHTLVERQKLSTCQFLYKWVENGGTCAKYVFCQITEKTHQNGL